MSYRRSKSPDDEDFDLESSDDDDSPKQSSRFSKKPGSRTKGREVKSESLGDDGDALMSLLRGELDTKKSRKPVEERPSPRTSSVLDKLFTGGDESETKQNGSSSRRRTSGDTRNTGKFRKSSNQKAESSSVFDRIDEDEELQSSDSDGIVTASQAEKTAARLEHEAEKKRQERLLAAQKPAEFRDDKTNGRDERANTERSGEGKKRDIKTDHDRDENDRQQNGTSKLKESENFVVAERYSESSDDEIEEVLPEPISVDEERTRTLEGPSVSAVADQPTSDGGRPNGDANGKVLFTKPRSSSVCEETVKDQLQLTQLLEAPEHDAIDTVKKTQLLPADSISPRPNRRPKSSTLPWRNKTIESQYSSLWSCAKKRPKDLEESLSEMSFNSTQEIRSVIFEQWMAKKKLYDKKKTEAKKLEKAEKEKASKEETEKRMAAKLAYDGWKQQRDREYNDRRLEQKRKERMAAKKELEEKHDKVKESEVSFRMWKEKKDERLKEEARKKRKEEREKQRTEQESNLEKQKETQSAFKSWKARKDEEIFRQYREVKKQEKDQEKVGKRQSKEKRIKALTSYYEWMEKKNDQEKEQRMREKDQLLRTLYNPTPAWAPPGRTIPRGK